MKKAYIILTRVIKLVFPEKIINKIIFWHNYPELHRWSINPKDWGKLLRRRRMFNRREKEGLSNIPIIIVSYNRLSYVKEMVEYLERKNKKNIIIVDNASTYPPLLEYYDTLPYQVIRLKKNYGHMVLWECDELEKYRKDFYILTDPDVIPIEECPDDYIEMFFRILKRYPYVRKVGFSLKLDDLPADSILAKDAIEWEKQFYSVYSSKMNAYVAAIDTTFALYIPDDMIMTDVFTKGFRTGYPYQARHLPWYKKKSEITQEDRFYSSSKITGWWDVAK